MSRFISTYDNEVRDKVTVLTRRPNANRICVLKDDRMTEIEKSPRKMLAVELLLKEFFQ